MNAVAVLPAVLPLALDVRQAAAALSLNVRTFNDQVAPELRSVERGGHKLYLVSEIERWLEDVAA